MGISIKHLRFLVVITMMVLIMTSILPGVANANSGGRLIGDDIFLSALSAKRMTRTIASIWVTEVSGRKLPSGKPLISPIAFRARIVDRFKDNGIGAKQDDVRLYQYNHVVSAKAA